MTNGVDAATATTRAVPAGLMPPRFHAAPGRPARFVSASRHSKGGPGFGKTSHDGALLRRGSIELTVR
jgi:hypothetical protein